MFYLSVKPLAENLRDTGISVTALCPGLTDTDMVDSSLAEAMPPFMISQPDKVAREGFDALMRRGGSFAFPATRTDLLFPGRNTNPAGWLEVWVDWRAN